MPSYLFDLYHQTNSKFHENTDDDFQLKIKQEHSVHMSPTACIKWPTSMFLRYCAQKRNQRMLYCSHTRNSRNMKTERTYPLLCVNIRAKLQIFPSNHSWYRGQKKHQTMVCGGHIGNRRKLKMKRAHPLLCVNLHAKFQNYSSKHSWDIMHDGKINEYCMAAILEIGES